jgi:hypothetical protein
VIDRAPSRHSRIRQVFRSPALRFAIAVPIAALCCIALFRRVPLALSSGRTGIVGYSIYAGFNSRKLLDGYYLVAFAMPLLTAVLYVALGRVAPRDEGGAPRWGAGASAPEPLFASRPAEKRAGRSSDRIGAVLRRGAVGATLSLLIVVSVPRVGSLGLGAIALGTVAYLALLGAGDRLLAWSGHEELKWWLNVVGALGVVPMFALVAASTTVRVTSTGAIAHYDYFPLPLALVALFIASAWCWRRRVDASLDRQLVTYLVAPVALFGALAVLPGALGTFYYFYEGENLAGGWLMLHGAAPWVGLLQIHGPLDDGLRAMVGWAIFGSSRWAAHAGGSMFVIPAYWCATYLFAITIYRRRPALLVASLLAIAGGLSAAWDPRLLLWPLVLIALRAQLERPSPARSLALGLGFGIQCALVPEALFGLVPILAVLVLCDLLHRPTGARARSSLPRSVGFALALALSAGIFACYLAAAGGDHLVIAYLRDFTDQHVATSGIPPFRAGAVTSSLGIHDYVSRWPALWSSEMWELVAPVGAVLLVIGFSIGSWRRWRRLSVEHYLGLCSAGWTLLWFQEPAGRPDAGHLGYAFATAVPLLLIAVALVVDALERAVDTATRSRVRDRVGSPGERARSARLQMPALAVLCSVALVAPTGIGSVVHRQVGALHAVVPDPAPPPVVTGGPSLGYASGAMGAGFAEGLASLLERYAGPSGPVFDFSNAPGLFYYLLDRRPGSVVYDINEVESPAAQRLVIGDLEHSRPRVVVWQGFGASAKDEIPNEVRYYLVAHYLLAHYRPLETFEHEHLLIADDDPLAPPLAEERPLDLDEFACSWGEVPNFLLPPSTDGALPLRVRLVSRRAGRSLYALEVPAGFSSRYGAIEVRRSSASRDALVALADRVDPSGAIKYTHEIDWVETAGHQQESVEVSSCLQWQGYDRTLYLEYEGPGRISSVALERVTNDG